MLSKALQFVKDQVEEFLILKGAEDQSILRIGGVSSQAKADKSERASNVINLSVVNIEEEESMAHRQPKTRYNSVYHKKKPAVYINVYLLFSMDFKSAHYMEGLHWLSTIIQFFQQHNAFMSDQTPLPKGIDKLNFELVNVEIDNMSRFWGALGGHYQPSVIYKMRMIAIDGEAIEAELTEIRTPETHVGL